MTEKKYNNAIKHLEIAREFDEYETIDMLKLSKDIKITNESAPAYRANQIAMYVDMPYTPKIKKMINMSLASPLYKQTVQINGKRAKIPMNVDISTIAEQITDELCDTSQICSKDLTENEWENLQKTPQWKKEERNVAREIIADEINGLLTQKPKKRHK